MPFINVKSLFSVAKSADVKELWLNTVDVNYIHLPVLMQMGNTILVLSKFSDSKHSEKTLATNESINIISDAFNLSPATRHDLHGFDKYDGQTFYVNPAQIRTIRQHADKFWCLEFRDGSDVLVKEFPSFI